MKTIYELNVEKDFTIEISDTKVEVVNWDRNSGYKGRIEKFLDELLFAEKPVYFEDKIKAEKHTKEALDMFSNKKCIEYQDKQGAAHFEKFNVLDMETIEPAEGDSEKTTKVRITVLRETRGEYDNNYFKEIDLLAYRWCIKEKTILDLNE